MEFSWKVVSFEKFVNDRNEDCVRLYVARPLILKEGHSGEGLGPIVCFTSPMIGHMIIAVGGRYYRKGQVKNRKLSLHSPLLIVK